MRYRVLIPLLILPVIALAGCGLEETKATKIVEPNDQKTAQRVESPQDELESTIAEKTQIDVDKIPVAKQETPEIAQQAPAIQEAAKQETPKQEFSKNEQVDVREVGPPDPPERNPVQEQVVVESPLRDIPLPTEEEPDPEPVYVETQTIDIPETWTRMKLAEDDTSEVWVDFKAKQVIVAGQICLDRGGLEMFVCPFGTKEHESVVAVNSRSFQIHGALLSIGVNPGKPVQWHPDYQAATGPVIQIDVMWKDENNDKIVVKKAQEMIRNFRTKKPLELDWVFGGSVLETDEESGQTFYYGDGGELVCLSNFSTATMDLPIESSQAAGELLYEANPETIPTPGTKVYVIFKPKVEEKVEKTPETNGE